MSSRDRKDVDLCAGQADAATGRDAVVPGAGPELLDDGQEEVFSYTAVANGVVEDPKALSPDDLARTPKSPVSLTAGSYASQAVDREAAPRSSSEKPISG